MRRRGGRESLAAALALVPSAKRNFIVDRSVRQPVGECGQERRQCVAAAHGVRRPQELLVADGVEHWQMPLQISPRISPATPNVPEVFILITQLRTTGRLITVGDITDAV